MKKFLLLFSFYAFLSNFCAKAQPFMYALEFDGNNSYVEANSVSDALSGTSEMSMEVWIKYPGNLTESKFILTFHQPAGDWENVILFGIDKNGRLALNYNENAGGGNIDLFGTTSLAANEWNHLALTISGDNTAVAYINGQVELTWSIPTRPVLNGHFSIGQDFDNSVVTNDFIGQMDEVRIWNVVRTRQEIQNNMNTELLGTEPGLIAYYKMNDGNGSILADDSGNMHPGTLKGGVSWTNYPPVLQANDTSPTWYYGSAPLLLFPAFTISDTEGDPVSGMKIYFSSGHHNDQDNLHFTNQNGITGTFDKATGVLSLKGTASTAAYQTAVRSITYTNNAYGQENEDMRVLGISLDELAYSEETGHYYEYINTPLIWAEAKSAAEAKKLYGMQGYLATVTSSAENDFIYDKILADAWLGATDEAQEGKWIWACGPEAGIQFWTGNGSGSPVNGNYANWNTGEPNNSAGSYPEHYMEIFGTGNGTWNDLRAGGTRGYVIEYGGMPGDADVELLYTSATLNVGTNRPPVANPDGPYNVATGETVSGNILLNDSDADGNDLHIESLPALTQGSFVSFNLADGSFEYEAPVGWIGTILFNYTVTDGIAAASGTAAVSVTDNIPPVAVAKNISVPLDASGTASISVNDVNNGSSDNIEITGLTLDKYTFTCADFGPNTVTLTAKDAAGNESEAAAVVTVTDVLPPEIIAEESYVFETPPGACSTVADIRFFTADNCTSNGNLAFNGNTYGGFQGWKITQNGGDGWKVSNGWFTTSYFTGAKNQVIDLLAQGYDAATLDAAPAITVSENYVGSWPEYNDTYFLNIELRDAKGNRIQRYSSGNLTCSGAIKTASHTFSDYGAGVRYIFVEHGGRDNEWWAGHYGSRMKNLQVLVNAPDITPNLPVQQIAGIKLADEFPAGTTQNSYRVMDYAGNTSTAEFDVIVIDNTLPVAITQNKTLQLNGSGSASLTAAEVDNGSNDACGIASMELSQTQFNCSHLGTNEVTLTVTDNNNNVSSATAVITVEDNVAPVVITRNVTVQLDETGNGSVTAAEVNNGSGDACGIASMELSQTHFDCSQVGTNEVTLTVTDNNNNVGSATAVITVEDHVAPVALARNATVHLDETGNGSVTAAEVNNGSGDACGIASLELSQTQFNCSHVGTNEVILTVTDNNSNVSTATAVITVEDHEAPAALAQNVTVQLDETGNGSVTAEEVNNGSYDACGIASLELSQTGFDCSHVGTNDVILTVTDNNNNVSTATAVVTVEDHAAPIALARNVTVQLDETGNGSVTAAEVNNGSSDACGIASLELSQTDFDCSHVGTNEVILTVTDNNGNSSTATAVVTVADIEAPVIDSRALTVYLRKDGTYKLNRNNIETITKAGEAEGSTTDNCTPYDQLEITVFPDRFSCEHEGMHVPVTIRVTDASGNTTTGETTVWVIDPSAPEALCKDLTVYLDTDGNAAITAADLDAGSTDACGMADIWLDTYRFDCSNLGENSVTFFAKDIHNNWSSCISAVTVADNSAPSVLAVPDVQVEIAKGMNPTQVDYPELSVADNCSFTSELMEGLGPDGLFPLGTTTETWKVTDAAGNSTSVSFDVTVTSSNSAPAVVNPLSDQWITGLQHLKIPVGNGKIFSDADGDELKIEMIPVSHETILPWVKLENDSLFFLPAAGDTGCVTVTLRAADPSGAFASHTFSVCIEDDVMNEGTPDALHPDVQVYPNPAYDKAIVKLRPAAIYQAEVKMLDMNGRLVLNKTYPPGEHLEIDVSDKVSGLYLLNITVDGKQFLRKLMINQK